MPGVVDIWTGLPPRTTRRKRACLCFSVEGGPVLTAQLRATSQLATTAPGLRTGDWSWWPCQADVAYRPLYRTHERIARCEVQGVAESGVRARWDPDCGAACPLTGEAKVRPGAALLRAMRKLLGLALIIWLLIGGAAAFQRGYLDNSSERGCAELGTIGLTVLAGPLNYTGLNPQIEKCKTPDVKVPEPSE